MRSSKWLMHCEDCDHGFYVPATVRTGLARLLGSVKPSACPCCKKKDAVKVIRKVGVR